MIHLVIGGIKSGKTKYALRLSENLSNRNNLQKLYLATANISDEEMQQKIIAHKNERDSSWATTEEPINIVAILNQANEKQVIMIDCISMWLTNTMQQTPNITRQVNQLIEALQFTKANVIIVSNEVGHSLVATNKLGRDFQNQQGLLNQKIAKICQKVDFVIAGLTLNLKG